VRIGVGLAIWIIGEWTSIASRVRQGSGHGIADGPGVLSLEYLGLQGEYSIARESVADPKAFVVLGEPADGGFTRLDHFGLVQSELDLHEIEAAIEGPADFIQ